MKTLGTISLSGCRPISPKTSVPEILPRIAIYGNADRYNISRRERPAPISTPARIPKIKTPLNVISAI
jgi:hypothetical protein